MSSWFCAEKRARHDRAGHDKYHSSILDSNRCRLGIVKVVKVVKVIKAVNVVSVFKVVNVVKVVKGVKVVTVATVAKVITVAKVVNIVKVATLTLTLNTPANHICPVLTKMQELIGNLRVPVPS
jgi:hypothetical protein